MAEEETLTLKMRVMNALRAARDIHKVADAAGDVSQETKLVGKASREAETATSIFGQSLGRVNLGFISMSFSAGAIVATLAALVAVLPFIALGLAAITAAVALLIPGFALFGGMMMRFKAQQGIAGTAANRLGKAFADVRDAFVKMVAPGADIVFGALSDALVLLRPLLLQLKGPMTAFATGVAQGIRGLAVALPSIMPQLIALFEKGGPALAQMIPSIMPLLSSLLTLAVKGLPVLVPVVQWLMTAFDTFVGWINDIVDWTSTDTGKAYIEGFGQAFSDVASIVGNVIKILADVTTHLGGLGWAAEAFLWTLHAIRDVIQWVADNIDVSWGAAFAAVLGVLQPVYDLIKSIWEKVKAVADSWAGKVISGAFHGVSSAVGAVTHPGRLVPGGASGGLVAAGGIGLVGERGPEVVRLPYRSRIDPLPMTSDSGAQDIHIHATLVTPDGEVVGQQVIKAANRRKAMR